MYFYWYDNRCHIRMFSPLPGGFIPNVIDKLITAFVVYAIIITFKKIAGNLVAATVVAGLGTIIIRKYFPIRRNFHTWCTILPILGGFYYLFTVVLPAVAMNGIAFFFIYPIVKGLVKRSSFKTALSN